MERVAGLGTKMMDETLGDGGGRRGRWRIAMWAAIAAILISPLVAMQFTREVDWDAADFAFATALLAGGGAAMELAVRLTRKAAWRLAIGLTVLVLVMLVWADGAVGVF